jgi:hypothetical protein
MQVVTILVFFFSHTQLQMISYVLLVYNVKHHLKPKTGAYKQVKKSPIGIARMLPDTWDWEFI